MLAGTKPKGREHVKENEPGNDKVKHNEQEQEIDREIESMKGQAAKWQSDTDVVKLAALKVAGTKERRPIQPTYSFEGALGLSNKRAVPEGKGAKDSQ
jgi:hypothetical protein